MARSKSIHGKRPLTPLMEKRRKQAALDRALSDAQQAIGSNLSPEEAARNPGLAKKLSDAWNAIEDARVAIRKDR